MLLLTRRLGTAAAVAVTGAAAAVASVAVALVAVAVVTAAVVTAAAAGVVGTGGWPAPPGMPAMLTAVTWPASVTTVQAPAASFGGSGRCFRSGLIWVCVYSGGTPGGPGWFRTARYVCAFTPAPAGILERTGTGPPSPGDQWDIMTCPGSRPGPMGGQLIEVSIRTGRPAVSPLQLLRIAVGALVVPELTADTAPPRGRPGLVGLPEWFWVPRSQWRPVRVTVTAGPVWVTAVATPVTLTFEPGGMLPAASCPGPGTPFDGRRPASAQRTSCSFTYPRPSAGQPGAAYRAALAVTWTISWTGSGGAGGVITTGYTEATMFGQRIAQAEALVTTP